MGGSFIDESHRRRNLQMRQQKNTRLSYEDIAHMHQNTFPFNNGHFMNNQNVSERRNTDSESGDDDFSLENGVERSVPSNKKSSSTSNVTPRLEYKLSVSYFKNNSSKLDLYCTFTPTKLINFLTVYCRYMDWYNNKKNSNTSVKQISKQSISKEPNNPKTKKR